MLDLTKGRLEHHLFADVTSSMLFIICLTDISYLMQRHLGIKNSLQILLLFTHLYDLHFS